MYIREKPWRSRAAFLSQGSGGRRRGRAVPVPPVTDADSAPQEHPEHIAGDSLAVRNPASSPPGNGAMLAARAMLGRIDESGLLAFRRQTRRLARPDHGAVLPGAGAAVPAPSRRSA